MASTKTLRPLVKEVYLGTLTGVVLSFWQFLRTSAKLIKTLIIAFFRPTHITDEAVAANKFLSPILASRITFELFILLHVIIVLFLKTGYLKPLDANILNTMSGEVLGLVMDFVYQTCYALTYLLGLCALVLLQRAWLWLAKSRGAKIFFETHLIYSYNALFLLGACFNFFVRMGSNNYLAQERTQQQTTSIVLVVLAALLHGSALSFYLVRRASAKGITKIILAAAVVATLMASIAFALVTMLSITSTV